MSKGTHAGAVSVKADRHDLSKKKRGAKRTTKSGDSSESASSTDGAQGSADIVNPYCKCNPCRCELPCTCGLHLVGRSVSTRWDSDSEQLVYSVTETYEPD